MNISVSNIVWSKGARNLINFFDHLETRGIRGVELALSCFWDEPAAVGVQELRWLKNELTVREIEPVSLHSLTFTRPDLELFMGSKQRSELSDYLKIYADIANSLGCKNIVFGSPKSRTTYEKPREELNDIFLDFITGVDQSISNVNFNIEPLSKQFCDYLNDFQECVDLLDGRNLQQIFIQLDVRTVIETGENISEIFENALYIRHTHAGNPGLKIPGTPYRDTHTIIKNGLTNMKYEGFVTAEIASQEGSAESAYLDRVIDSMMDLYGE
jgi:sugar phosphate isomerase/epimerase